MHHDAASGLLLDHMVPANMIAVAVGADDRLGIADPESRLFDEPKGGLKIALITCVNQDLCVTVKDKMVAVEPPALNEEKVLSYGDDRIHNLPKAHSSITQLNALKL